MWVKGGSSRSAAETLGSAPHLFVFLLVRYKPLEKARYDEDFVVDQRVELVPLPDELMVVALGEGVMRQLCVHMCLHVPFDRMLLCELLWSIGSDLEGGLDR